MTPAVRHGRNAGLGQTTDAHQEDLLGVGWGVAEGMGFEPMVTRSATTAFEAAPFVRSGNLP